MKKQLTIKNLLLVTTSMGLISCVGQSSDPMSKYADLKVSQPTSQQSETQTEAIQKFNPPIILNQSKLADLNLNGPNVISHSNFIENQESILYFSVVPRSLDIKRYSVEISEVRTTSKIINEKPLIFETDRPNIFGLKWKPSSNIINPGANNEPITITFQSRIIETSKEVLKNLVDTNDLLMSVNKDSSIPIITQKMGLENPIDEGSLAKFTIDIQDLASTSITNKNPEIIISSYEHTNTEAFLANGSIYVNQVGLPQRSTTDPSKWRFFFNIKPDNLPLDKDRKGIDNPLAPSVGVCFYIRATSVINTYSIQQQVCFKARYAAQAPVIVWENEALKEVTSSVATVMKFKIASGNDLGQVELKDPQGQISELSGSKELKCSSEAGGKLSSQVCELSWTPACVKAATTKKLTLKIDNKTGSKQKSQIFTKEFTVLPNEEACTKKPATKSTITPKSKSATSTSTAKKTEGA